MISRSVVFSILAVLVMGGCDDTGDPLPPPPDPRFCDATRTTCTDDTICGEAGCEQAFERRYRARIAGAWTASGLKCLEDRDCVVPADVVVYFTDRADPILDSRDVPSSAEIWVTEGSSLVFDFGSSTCEMELTAAHLDHGLITCIQGRKSATLRVSPMPL